MTELEQQASQAAESVVEGIPALELLLNSFRRGRIAHAYLLVAPDRRLLEAAGQYVARAVLCSKRDEGADGSVSIGCGRCPPCRLVIEGRHPDLFQLRPRGKLRQIQVGDIRTLERELYQHASVGVWRVALIYDADRMNVNAANAFLKTLEEPPPNVVIVLLTEQPERLLETIRSRCLRLDLTRGEHVSWSEAQLNWLEFFTSRLAEDPDDVLVCYSGLARLLEALEQLRGEIEQNTPELSELEQESLDDELRQAVETERTARIEAEYREARREFLRILVWWARDLWLATLGVDQTYWRLQHVASATRKIAERLSPASAFRLIREMERSLERLETNVQEALALELMLLKLRPEEEFA